MNRMFRIRFHRIIPLILSILYNYPHLSQLFDKAVEDWQ